MKSAEGWVEPDITINGVALTFAQAMTVRVAIQSFVTSLADSGLGNDEHGKTMTKNYLARITEVNRLIMINQA